LGALVEGKAKVFRSQMIYFVVFSSFQQSLGVVKGGMHSSDELKEWCK
jgi:hypothetical protein